MLKNPLLLAFLSLIPAILAVPAHEQAVFTGVQDHASHFLTDAKNAILEGKHDMQKWVHAGKDYIKQDGLLC